MHRFRTFLDPKVDFLFKKLFGQPGNEVILIAFLNAVLQPPVGHEISQVEILNPTLEKDYLDDKLSILDIRAYTAGKVHYNIEIQRRDEQDMIPRSIYYASRIIYDQLSKGEIYIQLLKTVTINLVDFHLLRQSRRFHNVFHLYEAREKFQLSDLLEFHVIEMPKLRKQWKARQIDDTDNPLVKWLLLLEAQGNDEIAQKVEGMAMSDPILNQAVQEWERLSYDSETRQQYEARMKSLRDHNASIHAARVAGETKKCQESLCTFLDVRFGEDSSDLQKQIQTINDLDLLNQLLPRLFAANSLAEAQEALDALCQRTRSDQN